MVFRGSMFLTLLLLRCKQLDFGSCQLDEISERNHEMNGIFVSMSLKVNLDLKEFWYPISKTEHVHQKPIGLHILGEPIVLFKSGSEFVCLSDKCAHRSAPLSIGHVINGNIECKYHGWQYDKGGNAVIIPAKLKDRPIPANAKIKKFPLIVKDGLIWIYPGKDVSAPVPDLFPGNERGWTDCFDRVTDLDIDHSLMVENLLDPAHLPFTHDGTISSRSSQTPLEMEVQYGEKQDFIYGILHEPNSEKKSGTEFRFIPPCHVRLKTEIAPGWFFEQTMHCVPTRPGHMRLIYRQGKSFLKWIDSLPGINWYLTYFSDKIVMQDYELLHGQQLRLEQKAKPWNSPIAVDQLPKTYRLWLQKTHGWFNGFIADIEDLTTENCHGCGSTDNYTEYRVCKQPGVNQNVYLKQKSYIGEFSFGVLSAVVLGLIIKVAMYKS